jgi:oligopeptidase B
VSTPVNNCSRDKWRDVIPNRGNVLQQSFDVFKNYLVLSERIDGISKIRVIGWQNGIDKYISFDEPTYVSHLGYNPQLNTDSLRIGYSSLITPFSVIDYNMVTDKRVIRKTQPVIGYNKNEYVTEYKWAIARVVVKIPISIMHKKGTIMDGNNPYLLHAYGSYGLSFDPDFNSSVLSRKQGV